jgi:hypothetical protein
VRNTCHKVYNFYERDKEEEKEQAVGHSEKREWEVMAYQEWGQGTQYLKMTS